MRTRGAGEDGMALLVVMVLMGVMLTAGFALVSTVDTQSGASRSERVRDSSFNLAESALNAQAFALVKEFPGSAPAQEYAICNPASGSSRCPNNALLMGGGSPDLAGATWQTSIRDNGPAGSQDFYSDAATASQPRYDANGDGKVWVRAQAVAEGHTRTLVALAGSAAQDEDIPHVALLAGRLEISNSGKKELLKSNGGAVAVRCNPATNPSTSCVGQAVGSSAYGKLGDQITGTTPVSRYGEGDPTKQSAMTPEARARLKATAVTNGTYFTSCPSEQQMTGKVVYVDVAGECRYTGNSDFNTEAKPGMLILERGSLYLGGNTHFYGVVYAVNASGLQTDLVQSQGNARITGGVLIDGDARMLLGSSGVNLEYDINAYQSVVSNGSAGVIQNTFREIRPA